MQHLNCVHHLNVDAQVIINVMKIVIIIIILSQTTTDIVALEEQQPTSVVFARVPQATLMGDDVLKHDVNPKSQN